MYLWTKTHTWTSRALQIVVMIVMIILWWWWWYWFYIKTEITQAKAHSQWAIMLIMGKPIKQLCPPYRFFAPYYIPSFIAFGSCCMLGIFRYRVFLNETKNNLCILKVEFQVPRVSCPIYNYARLAWPPADCFSFYALFLSFCLLTASHSNNEYVDDMREVWRSQNNKEFQKGADNHVQ